MVVIKNLHTIGGGTFSHVRCHMALATPAFGSTAKYLHNLAQIEKRSWSTNAFEKPLRPYLHLTRMAGGDKLVTNEDVAKLVDELVADPETGMIIFNPALVDFRGHIVGPSDPLHPHELAETPSGKYETRLKSRTIFEKMLLYAQPKILSRIRKERKDIFLVAFKTTAGATDDEQYFVGLKLLKENSCNLVLANDVVTRQNMIITPEEARYHITQDRDAALQGLMDMAMARYGLTYNRTEIVPGEPVPWNSNRIPQSLRSIVDWCIAQGAYKPIRGKTVGHFSFRENDGKFLVSRRKVNFNQLEEFGVVEVAIDADYKIKATGNKPSAGAQTQRLIFEDHPQYDCIIHFHCPLKDYSDIPVRSQYEYECGSIECGRNTSQGLKKYGSLSAVMLDQHGPNIVFNHAANPEEVINFIRYHCDLSKKTGGYDAALA